MKIANNSLGTMLPSAAFVIPAFFSLLAFCALLFATSCNTQKASTEATNAATEQRPARQGQRGQRPDPAAMLAEMDSNKDGKLAKSEVSGRLLQDFARFDTDKDGFITREELENAPRPEGRRGGGPRQ